MGYFDDYLPYSATDEEGNVTGVIKDVVPELFSVLNASVEIEYKAYSSYEAIGAALNEGTIDFAFPTYGNFWATEKYGLLPTDSVFETYFNLIFDGEYPDMDNAVIAVRGANATVLDYAEITYPQAEKLLCDTTEECLDAVVSGKADAAIVNGHRTGYFMRQSDRYKKLVSAQIAGEVPFGFVTLMDNHTTHDLLNHAISLIDPDFALTHSYQYEMQHQTTVMEFIKDNIWLPAVLGFLIMLLLLLFFARDYLKNKQIIAIEKKRHEEKAADEAIISSLSSIYFTTLEIDAATGKIRVLQIPEFMKDRFEVDGHTYNDAKEKYVQMCVADTSQDSVREFLDYETLIPRLKKSGYLQKNYLGRTEGWCRITLVPVKNQDSDEIDKIVFAVASIEDEKQREASIRFKAEHDELTGAWNRTAYTRITEELADNMDHMAFMILDIDLFKHVNDNYGHDIGDLVLKNVAETLHHSFRKNDQVVRYGGDEFVIFFSDCSEGFEARIAQKISIINETLSHPMETGIPPVTVSAGYSMFDGPYSESVFKCADIALYHTKTNGRAGVTVYDPSLENN